MPFYVADYIADTMHLTTIEHGAYLLLIFHYWRRGPFSEADAVAIAKLSQAEWQTHRNRIAEFFQPDNGIWRHRRIDAELKKSAEQREKKQIAAFKGNSARWHRNRIATASQPDTQADSNRTPDALRGESPSPSPSHIKRSSTAGEVSRPSEAEVLAYAEIIGLAPWRALDWFQEMQGGGWLDHNHRPINDWKAVLARVKTKWEAEGRPNGPPGRPGDQNAGNRRLSVSDLRTIRDTKSARANDLRNRHATENALGWQWGNNQEQRKEWQQLRADIKELNRRIEEAGG